MQHRYSKIRTFDSLCAIPFEPLRRRACTRVRHYQSRAIKITALCGHLPKITMLALLFRDISVAKNGRFKRRGAHRIKNNVGLTPGVTVFSRNEFHERPTRHPGHRVHPPRPERVAKCFPGGFNYAKIFRLHVRLKATLRKRVSSRFISIETRLIHTP